MAISTRWPGRAARAALASALAILAGTAPAHAYDAGAWRADFVQLRKELAAAYANLDWAVEARRMDLPALSARTEAQLAKAASDDDARRIFERFLAEFGDGHVRIDWPEPPEPPASPHSSAAPPAAPARSCADLGYRPWRDKGMDFGAAGNYEPLPGEASASFPAGILTTPKGAKLGILRIPLFMYPAYPEICEKLHSPSACDGDCERRLGREVEQRMSRALATQLAALAGRRVDAIVIDITGNAGGTDWAEAAARIVTAPGVAAPRMSFIRHPHWVRELGLRLRDVEADLARGGLSEELRSSLLAARSTLAEAKRIAAEPCDRAAVWRGEKACPLVGPPMLRSTGALEEPPRASLEGLQSDHALYMLSRYEFTEGVYRGPLAVLVDGGTASAAELFAATLQNNRRATIIGTPTHGSGCGYTSGGMAIRLARSGGQLKLPDCVRYRADGTNEVEGVEPDVLVPWRVGLSSHQRSLRAVRTLWNWADRTPK
jgi:hypothetical protein